MIKTITISTKKYPEGETIEAEVYSEIFGVHPMVWVDGKDRGATCLYTVTHLSTGLGIQHYLSLSNAEEFAHRLTPACWRFGKIGDASYPDEAKADYLRVYREMFPEEKEEQYG